MSADEKFNHKTDKLEGQAKEGFGKLTGDKNLETEGKTQQSTADLKDKLTDAKDTIKGALNNLTDRPK